MGEAPVQFHRRAADGTVPRFRPPAPQAAEPSVPAGGAKTPLRVGGITCQNCVLTVAKALGTVPGVAHAEVSLDAGTAVVHWRAGAIPRPELALAAVRGAGYTAELPVEGEAPGPGGNPWRVPLFLGIPVTAVLLAADWGFGLGMNRTFQWVAFALALPVQLWLGGRFQRGAWNQLRAGAANMDTLVALGSTTAFVFSVVQLLAGHTGHVFFAEAATILTFVSLGHFLEARMAARAGSAVRALLELAPATARRLAPDGTESEVPVQSLVPGDRVAIRPGDRIPVDALVAEGDSAVDESLLTGESIPVEKSAGASLLAGSVNQSGRLVARVTATGESTALARIVELVRHAQGTRAAVQRLADRVSAVFVPLIVAVAVGAGLWWWLAPSSARAAHAALAERLWHVQLPDSPLAAGVAVACAVLIVACPCAMGLATPVALMAGVNAGARRGILIRDAVSLETSGTIDTVVFDKTGTLTLGHPVVVAEEDLRGAADRVVPIAEIAASLARHSQHPLSQALAALAPGSLEVADWKELRGAGVSGRWWGQAVSIGSVGSFRDSGVDLSAAMPFLDVWLAKGATPALVVADGHLWGAFAFRDEVRPEAGPVVEALRRSGIGIYLLTGDHPRAAAVAATEAGIAADHVFAEVKPDGKVAVLRRLQAEGRRVAFVGDGINDGPALAAADLGIAMGRASDVAREAAGLVLLRADLRAVPEALALARATLRTIRQNLFWAFFYNAASVPLAALGMVSPVLCAVAMGLSDVIVIGNALRLGRRARQ
ncbi:MAG: cation-translocating P-type ATPase [Verrucomicrobia bacterium]|nr:MAG: cation-translocating P-type ATPase [Verrucomicrobiota bacterium]